MADREELRSENEIAADVLIKQANNAPIIILRGKDKRGEGTQGVGVHAHDFAVRLAARIAMDRSYPGMISAPFRAPHHSCGQMTMLGELALGAGGLILLDEVNEFRRDVLRPFLTTWAMMRWARPILVLTIPDGGALRNEDLFIRCGLSMESLEVA